jgi:hypothetical protein
MNAITSTCLKKYESLAKKDHKTRAGIELTFSDNQSNILTIFSSSRKTDDDGSITLLVLLAQVQFPKQKKVILLLKISVSDDSFSCASE